MESILPGYLLGTNGGITAPMDLALQESLASFHDTDNVNRIGADNRYNIAATQPGRSISSTSRRTKLFRMYAPIAGAHNLGPLVKRYEMPGGIVMFECSLVK